MQPIKTFIWPVVASIAIAGGSYFGSLAMNHGYAAGESPAATAKPTPPVSADVAAPAQDLSRVFRHVHTAMKDAVVNIHVVKKSGEETGQRRSRTFNLPPGMQLPPGMNPNNLVPQPDDQPEEVEGTGSGVIVSPDGYILTKNHVVEDSTDIEVKLDDRRVLKAKVVGTDPKTDLAVVTVDADHLTYAKFGDSDATEVGDWVLAFGSPLGFEQSMTQGIISAKDRQIGIIGSHNAALAGMTYEDFLQTDAAINPGNSGGPLVNLSGEVIGINSAIASSTGEYNGIGFSIPSNEAQYIMDSLIKNGKVVRGYLSVKIEDINEPSPDDKGLADSIKKGGFSGDGVLVGAVDPQGPAGKAGIQGGDVITAINGKPLESMNALRNQVARTAPGTKITLSVYRDGKSSDMTVAVGTQPATLQQASEELAGGADDATSNDLGVTVKSVDPATAKKYHLEASKGVLVTDSDSSSSLRPGDVILRVNRTAVNSPAELNDALSKVKLSGGVMLTVHTQDGMDRAVFVRKQ